MTRIYFDTKGNTCLALAAAISAAICSFADLILRTYANKAMKRISILDASVSLGIWRTDSFKQNTFLWSSSVDLGPGTLWLSVEPCP